MAKSGPELFRIGELSKRTGCSRRQIQDFLVMGLIRSEGTTPGGQHLFGDETIGRLRLIRQVLDSGGKEYTMAELIRTFKKFLKVVVLAASLAWISAAAAGRPALAGSGNEAPAAAPAGGDVSGTAGAALTAADRASLRGLFDGLEAVMTAGDAEKARALLATSLPPARVEAIVENLQAEFNSYSYRSFSCEYLPAEDLQVLGPGRARLSAIIRWECEDKTDPEQLRIESVGQAFDFDLLRENGEWRIAGEGGTSFFETLSSSQGTFFTRIFLWTAVGLVIFSFWGWMLLDACFREWGGRRGPWVTAMILALLVAVASLFVRQASGGGWLLGLAAAPAAMGLVYFFAVWMRQGAED